VRWRWSHTVPQHRKGPKNPIIKHAAACLLFADAVDDPIRNVGDGREAWLIPLDVAERDQLHVEYLWEGSRRGGQSACLTVGNTGRTSTASSPLCERDGRIRERKKVVGRHDRHANRPRGLPSLYCMHEERVPGASWLESDQPTGCHTRTAAGSSR